jgi:hypothetical protein
MAKKSCTAAPIQAQNMCLLFFWGGILMAKKSERAALLPQINPKTYSVPPPATHNLAGSIINGYKD